MIFEPELPDCSECKANWPREVDLAQSVIGCAGDPAVLAEGCELAVEDFSLALEAFKLAFAGVVWSG